MIYLDNSATTKQYDEVTDEMLRFMRRDFGNPSTLYQLGVDAEKAVKKARKMVIEAAFGERAGADWDVVFTSGGTEADNMAIFGAAKSMRRFGNRIVTTAVEHPAVLECCKNLEADGFEVVRVGVDRHCRPDEAALEAAVNEDTILVTVMHVNNEAGTIMPVERVRDLMKRKKAPGLFHCDAVQSFGKLPMPADADMISISGHKIHGPKGSGALMIRKKRSAAGRNVNIPAFILGGGQESGLRSGTENVPSIAGLGKAAEIAFSAGKREMKRLHKLRDRLREGLEDSIEDIIVNSPETAGLSEGQCCPTLLNVSFMGTRGEVILHTLEQEEIYVSTGSACSSNKKGRSHVLAAMGLKDKEIEGAVRFSLGQFNTEKDIEITIEKTAEAVRRFRRLGSFR